MYGKNKKKINDVRSLTFLKAYTNLKKNKTLEKIKSFNLSFLPPCQSELREHFLRTVDTSQIWTNAHLKVLTSLSLLDCGWKIKENKYVFKWFTGEQLLKTVTDVTIEEQPAFGNDKLFFSDLYEYKLLIHNLFFFCNGYWWFSRDGRRSSSCWWL